MNYFNTLPLRLQLEQLGKCRFMDRSEFSDGVNKLNGKKVVIVGCGAQGRAFPCLPRTLRCRSPGTLNR